MNVGVMKDYKRRDLRASLVYRLLRPRLNYSLKRFAQIFGTRGFEFIGDNF